LGKRIARRFVPKTAIQAASTPVRWRLSSLAETVASDHVSAACCRGSKDIDVLAIVVPELKFRDVQRQIFAADLVIAAGNTALQDAPEVFNRVGVNRADNMIAAVPIAPAGEVYGPGDDKITIGCPFCGKSAEHPLSAVENRTLEILPPTPQ
jgi:hypothetical protein